MANRAPRRSRPGYYRAIANRPTPTANRSVVNIMNEFSYLADVYQHKHSDLDLLGRGRKLASTPCSPLYHRHTSPDCELQAFLRSG